MHNSRKSTGEFIRTMSAELAGMARAADLKQLAYLLDLATHEAEHAAETGDDAVAPARASLAPKGKRTTRSPARKQVRRAA